MNADPTVAPLSVLVVDDYPDVAESTAALLTLFGFRARVASCAADALRAAAEEPPDAVLLDIVLPGMNGWELARRLRAEAGRKRLLLVAVTATARPGDFRRSEEAGIDLHLVKPAAPDVLVGGLHQFAGAATPPMPSAERVTRPARGGRRKPAGGRVIARRLAELERRAVRIRWRKTVLADRVRAWIDEAHIQDQVVRAHLAAVAAQCHHIRAVLKLPA